jgi:hypothetical protein
MDLNQFNARYKTDPDKEIKGIEVDIGENFKIVVARSGNARANKRMSELLAEPEVDMKRRAGAIDDATWDRIQLEVMSSCILVGWSGLTTADGLPVPYSQEKARELLANRDFMNLVREISGAQEMYRAQALDKSKDALGKA